MKTELSTVVKTMSQVSIPQDMIDKVDMKALLKGFKEDYDKLDNLKNTRENHEKRNFIGRWWNKDELEDAQLSAAELQASFSKKLGQLMVISVAQSQQLNSQQNQLAEQQGKIKIQTEILARNDEELKDQQFNLEEQNNKLEKLVNDYFELKGLTQDGALKLIKIANEVKDTRDSLISNFDNRMLELAKIQQTIEVEQAALISQQTQQLQIFKKEMSNSLDEQQERVEFAIKSALQTISQVDLDLRHAFVAVEQKIADSLSVTLQKITEQHNNFDQKWQIDRAEVLEKQELHQQSWISEVQNQNARLSACQSDYESLNLKLAEVSAKHQKDLNDLYQSLENLKSVHSENELQLNQRLKLMTLTAGTIFLLLTSAVGYLGYLQLM